jgi:hypothetical protein
MAVPEGATLSEDGVYYWDGKHWQPVNGAAGAGQESSGPGGGGATAVNVYYEVAGMSQPADHACWATSFAVVINYRDGSNLTPADVSNAVGVDINGVESWSDVTNAASHFHLQQSASACMDVHGWAQLLASKGPLWICVNGGSHAVVVNGVHGDGTSEGTSFYVTDPWSGPTATGLTGLAAMFEALDTRQPGDGLIIWHR